MARYKGPQCKICRRNRVKLFLKGSRCETAKCAIEKRNFPPGIRTGMQRKLSEYGVRLREKQKLRFFYGVSEKQIRRYFQKASIQRGITGHNLLVLFERRLDNVIFRSRLAQSRREARQVVRHGHFMVNNRKVNIPSFLVSEGDVISLKLDTEILKTRLGSMKKSEVPGWISLDETKKEVTFLKFPERQEIDAPVEEQLIVEFYSK